MKRITSNKAVRLYARSFCGLLLLTIGFAANLSAQSLNRIDRERFEFMLRTIKDDIKSNYYDPTYRGMDLDANFQAAQDKLKQANSIGQALGIVAQSLMNFNDSHTFFLTPPRSTYVDYGWDMRMIGNKCYVIAINPKTDAAKSGLKVGDELLKIENFTPNRKDFWKMRYYYRGLSLRAGLRVIARSPGGEPREIDVPAKVTEGHRSWNKDLTILKESPDNHRLTTIGNVLLWKMEAFDIDETRIDGLMGRAAGKSAIIFDMRGNGGGYEVALRRLVGHLFDRDVKVYDVQKRKEKKESIAKTHGKDFFKGKVIVLVDADSGSAAELFARVVQIEKRGVVLGDTSAGAVMMSRRYTHLTGAETGTFFGASITEADLLMTDGKSLEHIGVVPDETILLTGEDLAANRDPVLARAATLADISLTPEQAGKLFPYLWEK